MNKVFSLRFSSQALFTIVVSLLCFSFFISCEKNITVDLPKGEDKLVVEGWIEPGMPPFLILTKSAPYFDKADLASFQNSFVHGATVKVSDGTTTMILNELCSKDFSDADLMAIAPAIGVPYETLRNVNYCLYTSLTPTITGVAGKNYSLEIAWNGTTYTSVTQIPYLIKLDSVYFKTEKRYDAEGLGFAYAVLTDPDSLNNCYNWQAKRLTKDAGFLSPRGASSIDKFYNGKSFEFGYDRPQGTNPDAAEEKDPYSHHYSISDTIVIKFSTIDKAHYEFLNSLDNFKGSRDNPFASPTTIKSNITNNALGVWGGYGVTYDTIYGK